MAQHPFLQQSGPRLPVLRNKYAPSSVPSSLVSAGPGAEGLVPGCCCLASQCGIIIPSSGPLPGNLPWSEVGCE